MYLMIPVLKMFTSVRYVHEKTKCVRYPAPPLLREDGDGPCKFRNPIVQPTILLVCKQDRTLLCSIKALCHVGAVSCLQLSKPYHCMNKDKSILTFITSISLRGYITLKLIVWFTHILFNTPVKICKEKS